MLKVTVPGPEVFVHIAEPTDGVLPPSEALVNEPQIYCTPPTVAVVGLA